MVFSENERGGLKKKKLKLDILIMKKRRMLAILVEFSHT